MTTTFFEDWTAKKKPWLDLLEANLQCCCDLDNWQPSKTTGHTEVCRIHKGYYDPTFYPKLHEETTDEK